MIVGAIKCTCTHYVLIEATGKKVNGEKSAI